MCHFCKNVGHVASPGHIILVTTCPPPPLPHAVHIEPPLEEEVLPNVNVSKVSDLHALTIHVKLLSLNGQATVQVLPYFGADIPVAGRGLVSHLHEHPENLLPSNIKPCAVNGSLMRPISRLPVTITLGTAVYAEDFHINFTLRFPPLFCPGAARGLGILPECYPLPVELPAPPSLLLFNPPPGSGIMEELPSVFDHKVKVMEGDFFASTPPGQSRLIS